MMKTKLKNIVYSRWPYLEIVWIKLNKAIGRIRSAPIIFSGWGMTTSAIVPWFNEGDKAAAGFLKTHEALINKLRTGEFTTSQFRDVYNKESIFSELMWRHYIIYWSASYAAKATNCSSKNLVECGVCDGMGVFFAISALRENKLDFRCYLYDAWEGMKEDSLVESERSAIGEYSYLKLENTQENLIEFESNTVFNKGYIPDLFEKSSNPDSLVWLHIDLNSSLPTKYALEYFFEKIPKGGVILFDDYAWQGFADTQKIVDEFFVDKPGMLLPLPTGQSIFFKL